MLNFLLIPIFVIGAIISQAYAGYMGGCGPGCGLNMNYYGRPFGPPPVYYYPQLPFHTIYGPTPYYFRPHSPSPYRPSDCVECIMRYQRYTQPLPGSQGGMMAS